jgi:hypothetical protein
MSPYHEVTARRDALFNGGQRVALLTAAPFACRLA